MTSKLHEAVLALTTKRGFTPIVGPYPNEGCVVMRDDSDGRGPYIEYWCPTLGPQPTSSDAGFDANSARKFKPERKAS